MNTETSVISDASKVVIAIPRIATWKFGRCLLASSHAGTRLPIAALQDSGRSPSVRHASGSYFLLSQEYEKTGEYPLRYPPVTEQSVPTAALSTSGIRVEGGSFLSACPHKLPCIFSCKTKQETPLRMPPVKNPCV